MSNNSEVQVFTLYSTAIVGDITPILATGNSVVNLIDREAALTHLAALGYKQGDKVYLRCIQPAGGGKNLDGIFPDLPWGELNNRQAHGWGAYVIVNPGGHDDPSITHHRVLFYEHDGNLARLYPFAA